MIRYIVCFLLLFVYGESFAGKNAFTLTEKFNKALVEKDTVLLKKLLHDNVVYGHSNGWVQSKAEVISDLFNGKLSYSSITWNVEDARKHYDSLSKKGIISCGNVAATAYLSSTSKTRILHSKLNYNVVYEGKALEIKLAVMFVWKKEKGKWKLLARQSTKIN